MRVTPVKFPRSIGQSCQISSLSLNPETNSIQFNSLPIIHILSFTSHHAKPRHVTSHHVTSHHVTSHQTTSRQTTSHHAKPRHITSCHVTPNHVTSHHVTSRHITPRHVTSCHITPNHVMWSSLVVSRPALHRSIWSSRNFRGPAR